MNEQELNKKLAEWRFPDAKKIYLDDVHIFVVFEHGNEVIRLLTESLDACFKWLVPKVIKSADYSIIITQGLGRCIGCVRPMQGGRQYDAVDNQNPALALCLAIEKLIDGAKQ